MTLNPRKPTYIVRAVLWRPDGTESNLGNGYDFLTNDPNCLDRVFPYDPDRWDSQEEADAAIADLHVAPTAGEIRTAADGSRWYHDEGLSRINNYLPAGWREIDESSDELEPLSDNAPFDQD